MPTVHTIHCVLHRYHLVAEKLSGELHEALKVCIQSSNKTSAPLQPGGCKLSVLLTF